MLYSEDKTSSWRGVEEHVLLLCVIYTGLMRIFFVLQRSVSFTLKDLHQKVQDHP